jgi:hypothetical protein
LLKFDNLSLQDNCTFTPISISCLRWISGFFLCVFFSKGIKMNFIKTTYVFASVATALLLGVAPASAAIVNIDLAGAVSGTSIVGSGGSFAQTFAGQTVSGTDVIGSPSGPLTLAPSGYIEVASWNPGVSPLSNSLLPQPENSAPLSLLLNSLADSLTWTMGYGNGGSISVDLFGAGGNLINTASFSELSGYNVFNISGLGTFAGLTFRSNTDPAGLRFQNFSYNSVESVSPVPEPETYAMLLVGLGLIGFMARRQEDFSF